MVDAGYTVKNTYSYDPYGNGLTSCVTVASPYRSATTLYKFGARYYNPVEARWTQTDPSGQDFGCLYVGDDPVDYGDPSGNLPCATGLTAGNTPCPLPLTNGILRNQGGELKFNSEDCIVLKADFGVVGFNVTGGLSPVLGAFAAGGSSLINVPGCS